MKEKILVVNPGSTSTKIAYYEDEEKIYQDSFDHANEELAVFKAIPEQLPLRMKVLDGFLEKFKIDKSSLTAVVGRGGMVFGLESGGYLVGEELCTALSNEKFSSPHASNLGGLIGNKLSEELGIPAYIYDAVTGSNLSEVAKVTGIPKLPRKSLAHVLNSRAMAMKFAKESGKEYRDLRLIVAHLGGGISLTAHLNGDIVDTIGDDDGPFAPERSGSVQLLEFLKLCFSGDYIYDEMKKMVRGGGGMMAYLGTSDAREIQKMIADGDKNAELVYKAQAYQISKGIGELSAALDFKVDNVILTGGMSHSKLLTDMIVEHVKNLAPVTVMAGESEMEALALGAYRIQTGKEKAKEFKWK